MDYRKIYSAFIASRKSISHARDAYTEKHHIQPRSLGGSDDPENLVRLTARDHYFAHCCLAKIYGGKMWSALFAVASMAKTDSAARYFSRRRMVEASRAKAARRRSEQMTELWRSGEFKRHRVYEPWSEERRLRHSEIFSGRAVPREVILKGMRTRAARLPVIRFIHEDGRSFTGTTTEFSRHSGVLKPMVNLLSRGRVNSASGWVVEGTDTRGIRGRNPTVFCFVHRDGRSFEGTMREFRTCHECIDCGSLSKMCAGNLGSIKGWSLG